MEQDTKQFKSNYYKIYKWMASKLELDGNDLLVYAIIYGFSQDGESVFSGKKPYLTEMTNSSKMSVMRSLAKLEEKKYIVKTFELGNPIPKYNVDYIQLECHELNEDSYFSIEGWMIKKLDLKAVELCVYAIIHGFSQDGESEFSGSISYICNMLNKTKKTIVETLKSLVEKGLIIKRVVEFAENLTKPYYRVNFQKLI